MKKLFYLIPVLLLTIILTSCINTNSIEKDIHEYHHSYNEEYHYSLCECGEIKDNEAHTFTKEIIYNPTCEATGKSKYTCSCGYSYEEMIEALGHKPLTLNGTPASCDNTGLSDGLICETCGKTLKAQDVLSKLNHQFSEWEVDTPASCLSKGKEKRECSHCHLEEYRDIEKTGHTEVPYEDLDATCTHEGHTGGSYCSVCQVELTTYTTVDKIDHNYGEWTSVTDATCIAKGQDKRVCDDCGHTEYRVTDEIPHNYVAGDSEESTCTKHGHTADSHCDYCGAIQTASEELPLKDHEYEYSKTINNPTYIDE